MSNTSKMLYTGRVDESGNLKIHYKSQFYEELKMFAGGPVVITVEKKRKIRSLMQNAYYHAIVVQYVMDGLRDAGFRANKIETHEFLKNKFLKSHMVNEDTGEMLETIGSTKKLTTVEMMDFIAEIQQWAAEYLNVTIPDPEQQSELEFKQLKTN